MYKYLLFDLDNTLLDFSKAETRALSSTFNKFGISYLNENVSLFKKINKKYWELFEVGKISKEELLVSRFRDFFKEIKIEGINPSEFNSYYLNELTMGTEEIDNSYLLLSELIGFDISIVTNGVTKTQLKRIHRSRLSKFINHIYISEVIGYQKPKKEFFDYVIKDLKVNNLKEVLLIGDSLTSDIVGGISYGIDTVWFNPNSISTNLAPTYIISNIMELKEILRR